MSHFVIETAYRLPVYRQRSYEAETLEAACVVAVADNDWEGAEGEEGTCGDSYVTGAWAGCDIFNRDSLLAFPPRFDERLQRRADYFEVLLGLLKACPRAADAPSEGWASWRDRVSSVITEADAIISDQADPATPRNPSYAELCEWRPDANRHKQATLETSGINPTPGLPEVNPL